MSIRPRGERLLVGGLSLADSRGMILRVGGCRLRINGETRPCEHMDQAKDGLRHATMARRRIRGNAGRWRD